MARKTLCRHCLMEERDHPSARCPHFEPRPTRKRSTPPPATSGPADPSYVSGLVRQTLAQALHYVADLLVVDASIITSRAGGGEALARVVAAAAATEGTRAAPATDEARSAPRPMPATHAAPNGAPRDPRAVAIVGASLGAGQRALLVALAQAPAHTLSLPALTTITGRKRSTRDRLVQELGALGFVLKRGAHAVQATDTGLRALGDYERAPTGDALRAHWLRKLPVGHAEVLRVACAAYPHWIDRERIGAQTEHARSTRDRLIQELAARALLDAPRGQGRVRASDLLFSNPQPLAAIAGAS